MRGIGIGACAALATTALVVAKLAGWTAVSWWLVFAPVLVVGAIGFSLLLTILSIAVIAACFK